MLRYLKIIEMMHSWDFSFIKKIYVACPSYTKTGGTELLHQLVFEISKYRNCEILYIDYYGNNPVPQEFRKYVSHYVNRIPAIEINKANLLIVPETYTQLLYKYKGMTCVIWWLSVSNFIIGENNIFYRLIREFGHTKFSFLQGHSEYIHLVQSRFAMDYLRRNFIPKRYIRYLSDYINSEYFDSNKKTERDDLVLYNPVKGAEFTKKIIEKAKNIKFIPIINMTNSEVKSLMQRSKVYIDFGGHPGKDRIPREAALQGLCIITGRDGSAGNDVDVPILKEFKIEAKDKNIDQIVRTIRKCIEDYEDIVGMYGTYVNKIRNEKKLFEESVYELFGEIKC